MKKLSKRLLAMLLVAVMVVAAIPFGAFAEGETHTGHAGVDPDWDATSDGASTHTLVCNKCTADPVTKTEPHAWVNGECSVCHATCSHDWDIKHGSGTADGHTFLCRICGVEVVASHRTVDSSTANESYTVIPAVVATCTTAGHTAGKRYALCGYEDLGTEIPALGHNMVNGRCDRCGYTSEYTVVITGALTASGGINTEILSASTSTARAAEIARVSGMGIHDGHTGTGYSVTSKTYDDATHKLSLTVAVDEHKMVYIGLNADKTKHVLKCSVDGCSATSEAEHSYNTTTGVCTCGETDASHKFNYSIAIKTTGGLQLAESKTVALTEAAADAIKDKVADAIHTYFSSVYNDLTISTLNTAEASVNHKTRTILLTVDKQEPAVSHDDEIQVIYDDGTITYIPRKVGTWYFSTSNLGLDDTWGTTQAKLKIYDANGSRTVQWDSEDNDAFVKATDYKVEVKGINRTVTIYFMKTSTANPTTTDAFATKYYEANTRLGVLPSLPDGYTGWYVGQEELTVDTVYHWKEKSVYAYPGKGVGSGRVHLFIYNKDNELMKNVDVTENVQDNGLITKTGLMKTIEYQTGRKNPTVAGLFDESGWAYYLNNKNSTSKAKSSVDVGRAADRQGTQNIYVVLTNVSGGSNADTSNPKTGDTAMIGTAAIVMALAAVGMGTAFYMKKKELF